MRTTLKIDDDVLRAARSLARSQDRALGEVISDLARKGLSPQPSRRRDRGVPTFEVSDDVPPLTPEMVQGALDDA